MPPSQPPPRGGSSCRVRTTTSGVCRLKFAAATVLSGTGVGVSSSPSALVPMLRDCAALTMANPRSVRWPPRSTVAFVTLFQLRSRRLILKSGCVLTVDQAGISCFLPFLPVVPRRRLASPRSPLTTPRAVESSRTRRRSTVTCHSSRKYLAESFLSTHIKSYVRPVPSPQARPDIETVPDGQRIVHHREVSVRCLARCSNLAAATVGLADRSVLFQSAPYANAPLAVTMRRASVTSPSSSDPSESVSRPQ